MKRIGTETDGMRRWSRVAMNKAEIARLAGEEQKLDTERFIRDGLREIDHQMRVIAAKARTIAAEHRVQSRRMSKQCAVQGNEKNVGQFIVKVWFRQKMHMPNCCWLRKEYFGEKGGPPLGFTVIPRTRRFSSDLRMVNGIAPDWEYEIIKRVEARLTILREQAHYLQELRCQLESFSRAFKRYHRSHTSGPEE